MLSVASTRTGRKSSAIIAAPGEKCGLGRAGAGTANGEKAGGGSLAEA